MSGITNNGFVENINYLAGLLTEEMIATINEATNFKNISIVAYTVSPGEDTYAEWDQDTNTLTFFLADGDSVTSVNGDVGNVTITGESLGLEIGVDVQAYNADTVIDGSYVHTDNNFTTVEKDKLEMLENYVKPTSEPISYIVGLQSILDLKIETETDPTVPAYVKSITSTQISNWDAAYGWRDHALVGYLTSIPSTYIQEGANISLLTNDAGYITEAYSETLTTLSLTANTLTYTDENGADTDIDLSLYLDDTNLARIISGVYDPQSQSLIFTRDDASTFSINAAMFFDDTNLVLSVAGKTGTVTLVKSDISDFDESDYEPADSTILKDADIGVTVQAYSPNTVIDASYVHTDNNFTTALKTNYDTAYGWGNHASAGYEGATNKSTDIDTDQASNTKYPSVKAVYDWAVGLFGRLASANSWTAQQTFKETKETVYELTGTVIDPANGEIQYKTMTVAASLTESLESGQSVVLMLTDADTYAPTFPTMTWFTSSGDVEPTWTALDTIVIWKIGTTLYGAYVGSGVTP